MSLFRLRIRVYVFVFLFSFEASVRPGRKLLFSDRIYIFASRGVKFIFFQKNENIIGRTDGRV